MCGRKATQVAIEKERSAIERAMKRIQDMRKKNK